MRKQQGLAAQVLVYIRTSPFRKDDLQYSRSVTVPLRRPSAVGAARAPAFGLLIFGSSDAERFTSSMATDFLVHVSATASAALAALQA